MKYSTIIYFTRKAVLFELFVFVSIKFKYFLGGGNVLAYLFFNQISAIMVCSAAIFMGRD